MQFSAFDALEFPLILVSGLTLVLNTKYKTMWKKNPDFVY